MQAKSKENFSFRKMKSMVPVFGFLVFSFLPLTAFAGVLGDVNNSGVIDIVDALLVARYSAGLNPSGFDNAAADVDASGAINIMDALLIARYSAGLITQFPGKPATAPVASFSLWPQTALTGETVRFYALASYDLDGTIQSYVWDFGDGTVANGVQASHQYQGVGNFSVKLTVTDNSAKTGILTQTVSVPIASGGIVDAANYNWEDGTLQGFSTNNSQSVISNTTEKAFAGTHALKWQISALAAGVIEVKIDGPAVVKPGQKVAFRIWTPDGAPVKAVQPYVMPHDAAWTTFEWYSDWRDYNSLVKNQWTECSVTVASATNPAFTQQLGVQLEVTAAGTFTLYVDAIDWPDAKNPPKASFDYTPDRPDAGLAVSFDATGATDSLLKASDLDGTITSYRWDFGDGQQASGGTASHTYRQPGKYAVTLTVTDNDNLSHSLTRVVWCGQNTPAFAPPLDVAGTNLVDANGIVFRPQGTAIVDAITYTKADFAYLKKEFKVDMIRLPYIIERWYYLPAAQREVYLTAFDNYVNWSYELGIYILLDGWHESGTGDENVQWEDCKAGWKMLVPRYTNRTHLIWEVYNEPNKTTWPVWAAKAEELIDIISSYNPASKVYAVPGVNWAQEFDVRSRPVNRAKVVYTVHPYPQAYNAVWTTATWDARFGYIATEGYGPVLTTETSFPLFDKGTRSEYGEPFLRYHAMRGFGWISWIWGGWGSPTRDPNSYRADCYQFFWEATNGLWKP